MSPNIPLLRVEAFPRIAARNFIREPERALIATGRLVRLDVGRDSYYRWADLLPLMPDWAPDNAAPMRALVVKKKADYATAGGTR